MLESHLCFVINPSLEGDLRSNVNSLCVSVRILISMSWDIYHNRVKELDLEVGGGSKLEESCTMAEISHELSSPLFPPPLITHILYFLFSSELPLSSSLFLFLFYHLILSLILNFCPLTLSTSELAFAT